jgi:hypothetical protein
MFSEGFFVRILLAVLGVVLLFAILPPFFRLVGFPVSGDLETVIKIVIAAIAVYFVFRG